jgi:hypothetical protein
VAKGLPDSHGEERGAWLSGRETRLALAAVLSVDSGDVSELVPERERGDYPVTGAGQHGGHLR